MKGISEKEFYGELPDLLASKSQLSPSIVYLLKNPLLGQLINPKIISQIESQIGINLEEMVESTNGIYNPIMLKKMDIVLKTFSQKDYKNNGSYQEMNLATLKKLLNASCKKEHLPLDPITARGLESSNNNQTLVSLFRHNKHVIDSYRYKDLNRTYTKQENYIINRWFSHFKLNNTTIEQKKEKFEEGVRLFREFLLYAVSTEKYFTRKNIQYFNEMYSVSGEETSPLVKSIVQDGFALKRVIKSQKEADRVMNYAWDHLTLLNPQGLEIIPELSEDNRIVFNENQTKGGLHIAISNKEGTHCMELQLQGPKTATSDICGPNSHYLYEIRDRK